VASAVNKETHKENEERGNPEGKPLIKKKRNRGGSAERRGY